MANIMQPTQTQVDQAALVQTEILELLARLQAEGIDWRVLLTGTGCAIADVLNRNVGGAEIPKWFATMAAQTMHFAG
jgi:hypothetical protein